jgi:hypothetical protein
VKGGIQNTADNMTQLAVCFGTGGIAIQLRYVESRQVRMQTFGSVIEAAGLCIIFVHNCGAVQFPQCSLASESTVKAAE